MIDYEVKIFNNMYDSVSPLCAPKNFVNSLANLDFAKLPGSCLYEMDNATFRKKQSSTPVENYALITYTLEVYGSKRETVKKIVKAGDDKMISMNFNRISGQYVPNMDNPKVVRWVGRYEAVVDRDGNLYRRE